MSKTSKQSPVKAPITPVTEYRHTDVLIGAKLYLTVEDARGILAATTMPRYPEASAYPEDQNEEVYSRKCAELDDEINRILNNSRTILRNMAKAVLYQSGPASSVEELLNKF